MIKEGKTVETAREGEEILFVMDKTPFYAESGGQVGDSGIVENENVKVRVDDTQKIVGNRIVHRGVIVSGSLNTGDKVKAKVDEERRMATARNHSVTHLLHKALRNLRLPCRASWFFSIAFETSIRFLTFCPFDKKRLKSRKTGKR